jgi:hypothetical protein
MDRGLRRQCNSTRDGQDQLRFLAAEGIMQGTAVTEVSATNRTEGHQDRKTGWSGIPNRMVRFPQMQQQFLVSSGSSGCPRTYLLLVDQGAVGVGQGRGVNLRPMTRLSTTRRRVQRRLQQGRPRLKARRWRSDQKPGQVHSSCQTGQSGSANRTIRFF